MSYIKDLLISISTWCISISAFTSLVGIPIGYTSSAVGLKIYVITVGFKKYKSTIKKKKEKNYQIVLLAKSKLSRIGVFIYKAWIDWNISHDELVLTNNVLKEFYIKGKIKNSSDK